MNIDMQTHLRFGLLCMPAPNAQPDEVHASIQRLSNVDKTPDVTSCRPFDERQHPPDQRRHGCGAPL